MEFEGRVWKEGRIWLVEIPSLDLMTQGKSRKNALEMIREVTLELLKCYFESEINQKYDVMVIDYSGEYFGVSSTENRLLLALSLRRQREKSGKSIRETAQKLGSKSPNAYAQYERGKTRISLEQYEKLMHAVNPNRVNVLRVI